MHIQNANTKCKYKYKTQIHLPSSLPDLHIFAKVALFKEEKLVLWLLWEFLSYWANAAAVCLFFSYGLYNKIKGTFEHNKKSDAVTDNVFWNWAEVSADTRLQIADHSFALFQRDLKKRKWEREHLLNLERGQQVDVTGTTVHQSPICQ